MNDNHDAMATLADELERIGNMAAAKSATVEQHNGATLPPNMTSVAEGLSELSRAILLISQAVRNVK